MLCWSDMPVFSLAHHPLSTQYMHMCTHPVSAVDCPGMSCITTGQACWCVFGNECNRHTQTALKTTKQMHRQPLAWLRGHGQEQDLRGGGQIYG